MLENGTKVEIYDVLFVPGIDWRLFSVSVLVSRGFNVKFAGQCCCITKKEEVVTNLKKRGKFYVLRCTFRVENASQANVNQDLKTWHARLGHISMSGLK